MEKNDFSVIFSNSKMIVINKPYDVAMDRASTCPSPDNGEVSEVTVESWCHQFLEATPPQPLPASTNAKKTIKFVHQLDYATSGVLVLGLEKRAAAALAFCFQRRTGCVKAYCAYVEGHVGECTLDHWHRQCPSIKREEEEVSLSKGVMDGFTRSLLQGIPRGVRRVTRDALSSFCFFPPTSMGENQCCFSSESVRTAAAATATPLDEEEEEVGRGFLLEVCLPIQPDSTDTFRMQVAPSTSPSPSEQTETEERVGRAAVTHMEVIQHGYLLFPGPAPTWRPVTLVHLYPRTGRRHQLRVHCAALGHPIVGDVAYSRDKEQASAFPRMYLHAHQLQLPLDGRRLETLSPEEMAQDKKRRRRMTKGLSPLDEKDPLENSGVSHFIARCDFMPIHLTPND